MVSVNRLLLDLKKLFDPAIQATSWLFHQPPDARRQRRAARSRGLRMSASTRSTWGSVFQVRLPRAGWDCLLAPEPRRTSPTVRLRHASRRRIADFATAQAVPVDPSTDRMSRVTRVGVRANDGKSLQDRHLPPITGLPRTRHHVTHTTLAELYPCASHWLGPVLVGNSPAPGGVFLSSRESGSGARVGRASRASAGESRVGRGPGEGCPAGGTRLGYDDPKLFGALPVEDARRTLQRALSWAVPTTLTIGHLAPWPRSC